MGNKSLLFTLLLATTVMVFHYHLKLRDKSVLSRMWKHYVTGAHLVISEYHHDT